MDARLLMEVDAARLQVTFARERHVALPDIETEYNLNKAIEEQKQLLTSIANDMSLIPGDTSIKGVFYPN